MAKQEYEHRAVFRDPRGGYTAIAPTAHPAEAAGDAREYRKNAVERGLGGAVEIQRRPVGEWETVERWEVPAKGGE